MKHLSLLIGAVLLVSSVTPVEALRYPPGISGGGYIAVNLLGPTEVQSGDTFTYTVILTNDSSSFARNVQVTYDMPDGVRWLDRFGHQTCEQNINKIICTVEIMAPGSQSVPLRFTTDRLMYTNSAFCPRTITSSARVSTDSYDAFAGDNISPTLSTRITCYDPPTRSYRRGVDLQINLTSPRSITVGDTLTVSAVVTNAGTDNAMFVTMLMNIPSGIAIDDLPRFCQITGSMITCTNFTLRSGESRVLTFTAPIHSSFSCPTSLEWRAQVYSGAQNSYNVYRTGSARTSVSCRTSPPPSAPPAPHPPIPPSLNSTPSGNTGIHTSGWMNGTSWGTYNGTYSDPLHVCDLALDVIYPCPTGQGIGGGGGSSGGSSGGSGGGYSGGSTGGNAEGSGGGIGGTGGEFTDNKNGNAKNNGKASSSTPSPWPSPLGGGNIPANLPPDNSGNWVWTGDLWVYLREEFIAASINTNHWTLQYCDGHEQGTMTYEIEIANRFDTSIQDIDVVEMLNPTAVCIKNAAGGIIGPRHILWQIPSLAPVSTHTIRYTVGILPHVQDQFVIANLTHAGTPGPHILTRDFEMVEVERKMSE